ncbi:MAG: metallophosphoesterase family protein [Gemmatimonadaceae bacterium]
MPRRFALVLTVLAVAACNDPGATRPDLRDARRASLAADDPTLAWLEGYLASPHAPVTGEPAVLAGAGDIARCYPGSDVRSYQRPGPSNPAEQTARLLDGMPGATVMAVGDNAYEFGSPFDYIFCYHPTWGRHRARTRPSAGNHEYLTPGALGYFAYFGLRAAPPLGYYSYDVGTWHVVVLNSTPQVYACWPNELNEPPPPGFPTLPQPVEPGPDAGRACVGDRVQQEWLTADLAAHQSAACTIAYFHHPRFSSGMHGNHFQMQKIWDILYAAGADLVVSGHDHLYERFAPQDPEANPDPARGIRQFTVGTGGAEFYDVRTVQPNSEVIINTEHGVLALALDAGRYAWSFVATDGTTRDEGSGSCH